MPDTGSLPVWPGWKTVRVIGRGGYGAVYEIQREHYGLREKAAMKVVSIPHDDSEIYSLINDGYDTKSITERFSSYLQDCMREYSLMADMRGCANIVYCDDVKEIQHDDGIGWDIYIRMELLKPLSDAVGLSPSDAQVIKIGADLCSALDFFEKRNVLHRDIKPQNVFVASDGTYKLGDFGIARVAESTTRHTYAGTPNYMAPEIYYRQPYGTKADMYSLGLVLYWLLNERRLPFVALPPAVPSADDEETARDRRFRGEPLPPPVHGSEALKRIVLKACAYDPADRYRSAAELRNALLSAGAASSAPDNDSTLLNSPHSPRRFPVWAAVLAALVLLAVIAGAAVRSCRQGQEPSDPSPQVVEPPTPTPASKSEPNSTPASVSDSAPASVPDSAPASVPDSAPASVPGITTPEPGSYRSSSSDGTRLQFPLAGRYYDTPFIAIVKADKGVSIYLMPMPQGGHGNMGTVGDGEEVAILGYHADYYFFLTRDGRYGWNRKVRFETTDRQSFSDG